MFLVEDQTDVRIISNALRKLPEEALVNAQTLMIDLGILLRLPQEDPEWRAGGVLLRAMILHISAEMSSAFITTTTFADTVSVKFQRAS